MFMAVKYLKKWNLNDCKCGCRFAHCSVLSLEHFSYSHGEYGPLHAKSLQQQNLVSALTHSHSSLSVTLPECFSKFHTDVSLKKNKKTKTFCFPLSRFVIELCEPIQVKQLDIANFELFSSTPKDFLVSISDRYTHFSFYFLSINFKTDWHLLKGMWWVCDGGGGGLQATMHFLLQLTHNWVDGGRIIACTGLVLLNNNWRKRLGQELWLILTLWSSVPQM